MIDQRIHVLDSFRGLAIMMVLMFHFFSRWTNLYPYQDTYNFFRFGRLGVQFFFMISGFVIFYSLNKTSSFSTFWKNRLIRLLPSIVVASLITYIFMIIFDDDKIFPNAHYIKNFLVSITFIQPDIISSLFERKIEFDYINGSYWSLWHEVQFYFFISTMYFLLKSNFKKVFFFVSVFLVFLNYLLQSLEPLETSVLFKFKMFFMMFNLSESLPLFCYGVFYYLLYKGKEEKYIVTCVLTLMIFQCYVFWPDNIKILVVFICHMLFLTMIYKPKYLKWLNNKLLLRIGVSSYFLYLIHEVIGVLIIHKYGSYFNEYDFFLPLIIIVFMILVSLLYTSFFDKKINGYLKKSFRKD